MRTETIEETRGSILKLSSAQAQALQHLGRRLANTKQWWGEDEPVESRSAISCLQESPVEWRVTVLNAVGPISLGDLQIAVQPKIPVDHLLYLLGKSGELPRPDVERVQTAGGLHLWALVASWYVSAVEALLRGDLMRDYQLVTDELSVIRGHVHPLSSATAVYRGQLVFTCDFDDFTTDTPLNRLLKAAARTVSASGTLGWNVRRRASALLARMENVGSLRPSDEYAEVDRRTAHYVDAVSLARHVIHGQGRAIQEGDLPAWGFLIPTPVMVEAGLRAILQENLHPQWNVRKKGIQLSGSRLRFNPDLIFDGDLAVGDVKYKLVGRDWNRLDLYQVLAFGVAYRSRHCAVFNFRHPNMPTLSPLRVGDTDVVGISWQADEGLDPDEAAQMVVEATRSWLSDVATG